MLPDFFADLPNASPLDYLNPFIGEKKQLDTTKNNHLMHRKGENAQSTPPKKTLNA